MKSPERLSNESGQELQNRLNFNIANAPRYYRALAALAAGSLMREELDRAAGASNSPDVVRWLRRAGWVIHCERLKRTDRDGRACRPGRYTLQSNQRELAACHARERLRKAA